MSGYTVRFVGGPADGETRQVPELLREIRIPICEPRPFLVTSGETPYAAAGVAAYALVRTPGGDGFYRYCG